jgi:protein ImuB
MHQPLADALAVYPELIVADAEPEACEEALTALAAWAQRYSPATAPAPPSGLWLDITGCAHLWGSEEGLAEDLITRLDACGIPARAAIAPTFGAAYALAHHAERFVIAGLLEKAKSPHPKGRGSNSVPSPLPYPRADMATLSRNLAKAGLREKDRKRGDFKASSQDHEITQLSAPLAPLPVERLRISNETANFLKKLGLFTIGDVQNMPRAGLSRRVPDLLPQLDKALGRTQEAIGFLRPPTPWIERLRFADPISAPEDLERVTAKLLEMLCKRLEAERQGGLKFEVSFFRSDGGAQTAAVSMALPARDPARVMRLFREKLGFIDPGFGVDLAMLAAPRVEPLDERQASILPGEQSVACAEELAALIEALENRLGKGRVYRLTPVESYIPERALKRQPVFPETPKALAGTLKKAKRSLRKDPGYRQAGSGMTPKSVYRYPGNASGGIQDLARCEPGEFGSGMTSQIWHGFGERPIRLFARPQPIEVTAALPDAPPMFFRWRKILHRVVRAEGPERISPEWWRAGDEHAEAQTRDYYRVESTQGLRLWVFREGSYGRERMPRWFLHGLFP